MTHKKQSEPGATSAGRKKVELYTDGACKGNPGPGGYGAILRYGGHEKEISGFKHETTNNEMELLAAVAGLEALREPCFVVLTSDSNYLVKGMRQWVRGWIRNGWKTADKKPVKNKHLWEKLVALDKKHQIEWVWVKGHDGHPENERADELANQAIYNNR